MKRPVVAPAPARSAVVAGFVLIACVLGIVAMGSSASGADVPTQVVLVKADPPGSPQTLRPLTSRQRRQAKRIIVRDARLRQIVEPHSYRLVKIIPWGTEDKRRQRHREVFIGTHVQATLDTPKPSVVAQFPLVDYPRSKRPAYLIRTLQLTVRGLRAMTLYVDLKRRQLAGISPSEADEVIPPPGYTPPPPSGA